MGTTIRTCMYCGDLLVKNMITCPHCGENNIFTANQKKIINDIRNKAKNKTIKIVDVKEKRTYSKFDTLVIGPNEEQKKRGNSLVSQGQLFGIIGLLMLTFSLYIVFGTSETFNGIIYFFISFVFIKIGGNNATKGRKILEVKFSGTLDSMNPYEFEMLLDDLYSKMGYQTYNVKSSGDSGADVIAIKNGIKYVIQAKHYSVGNSVGSGVIRDVYGAMKMHDASRAIVVTTSRFTSPAIESANKMGIELVDRAELRNLIVSYYQ